MAETYEFLLPLGPSVNAAYRQVILWLPDGTPYTRRVATRALLDFQQEVGWRIRAQIRGDSWGRVKAVGYRAEIYVPSAGSDLSNRLKALEDILAEQLGFNDNAIYELSCVKYIDVRNPRIWIYLYRLPSRPVAPTERSTLL